MYVTIKRIDQNALECTAGLCLRFFFLYAIFFVLLWSYSVIISFTVTGDTLIKVTFITQWANSADDKLFFFSFRKEASAFHANCYHLHEMPKPLFLGK